MGASPEPREHTCGANLRPHHEPLCSCAFSAFKGKMMLKMVCYQYSPVVWSGYNKRRYPICGASRFGLIRI